MTPNRLNELKIAAKETRLDVVKMCYACGEEKAHLGGMLSCVEIVDSLYLEIMNLSPNMSNYDERDRFILSKGHAAFTLYSALYKKGFLSARDLSCDVRGDNTVIYRHCRMNVPKGIEFSAGSLGLGMSFAVGTAYALKKAKNPAKVFVLLGDGECNEGIVWESAAFAAQHNLDNLTVIVDKNNLQLDGRTCDVLDMSNMSERFSAFGFDSLKIDGHDFIQLEKAYKFKSRKPKAIIANTVKGKGISFAENSLLWHSNIITDELYATALKELGCL
ncbi:MAG: transketolase [Clostridia bacterium]